MLKDRTPILQAESWLKAKQHTIALKQGNRKTNMLITALTQRDYLSERSLNERDSDRISEILTLWSFDTCNNYAYYLHQNKKDQDRDTYYYNTERCSKDHIQKHGQLEIKWIPAVLINPLRFILSWQPAYQRTDNCSEWKKETRKCRKVTKHCPVPFSFW